MKTKDSEQARKERATNFILLLDIFGFEIFQKNSLEQLMINYSNEKLQQQFNWNVFISELQIYKEEQIDLESVDFVNNDSTIELFEQKTKASIFNLLQE